MDQSHPFGLIPFGSEKVDDVGGLHQEVSLGLIFCQQDRVKNFLKSGGGVNHLGLVNLSSTKGMWARGLGRGGVSLDMIVSLIPMRPFYQASN